MTGCTFPLPKRSLLPFPQPHVVVSEAAGPGRCAQPCRALTEAAVIGHAPVPFALHRCTAVHACPHVERPCTSATWAGTNCCGRKGPGLWPSYTGPTWGPQELPCMHSPSATHPWRPSGCDAQATVCWLPGLQVGCRWYLARPKPRVCNLYSWVGGWAGVSLSWLCCVRLPSQGRGVWIPADAPSGEVTFSCENFYVSSEDRS